MGRLIDADKFICRVEEELRTAKELQTRVVLSLLIGNIAAQPTAFDKEKVVAELSKEIIKVEDNSHLDYGTYTGKINAFKTAIEIVRKGGTDE